MCRWMAWLGQPVLIEELLFQRFRPRAREGETVECP
jgi:hypothetical protein